MAREGLSAEPVYTVLNPLAEEPEREITSLSPRLHHLEGKTINVINLHGGNEEVMESIAADLKAAVPGGNIVYYRTEGGHNSGPLTDRDWASILAGDAAIVGHAY